MLTTESVKVCVLCLYAQMLLRYDFFALFLMLQIGLIDILWVHTGEGWVSVKIIFASLAYSF